MQCCPHRRSWRSVGWHRAAALTFTVFVTTPREIAFSPTLARGGDLVIAGLGFLHSPWKEIIFKKELQSTSSSKSSKTFPWNKQGQQKGSNLGDRLRISSGVWGSDKKQTYEADSRIRFSDPKMRLLQYTLSSLGRLLRVIFFWPTCHGRLGNQQGVELLPTWDT